METSYNCAVLCSATAYQNVLPNSSIVSKGTMNRECFHQAQCTTTTTDIVRTLSKILDAAYCEIVIGWNGYDYWTENSKNLLLLWSFFAMFKGPRKLFEPLTIYK